MWYKSHSTIGKKKFNNEIKVKNIYSVVDVCVCVSVLSNKDIFILTDVIKT